MPTTLSGPALFCYHKDSPLPPLGSDRVNSMCWRSAHLINKKIYIFVHCEIYQQKKKKKNIFMARFLQNTFMCVYICREK